MSLQKIYEIESRIDSRLSSGKPPSEDNLNLFLKGMKDAILNKTFADGKGEDRETYLRFSNIGIPPRKLWYTIRQPRRSDGADQRTFKSQYNFIIGDFVENFLLLLLREAGFNVTDEQKEVEIDGVVGHLDVKIDGTPCDIKSASDFNFSKYTSKEFLQGDPNFDTYGYVSQLSGYVQAENAKEGAFIVVNKKTGEIAIIPLTPFDQIDFKQKVIDTKEMLKSEAPPSSKCYPPEPEGKSGNMVLSRNCTDFCPFFKECYKNDKLRVFQYATGLKYFTHVEKEPRVEEVKL